MPGIKGQRGTGPRAKTVRQHQLEGTKQKCRHDGYQNADPPMGDPPKPEGLSEMAAAEWHRMCDRMRLAGTLATTDDAALLRYVRSFELVERLEAQLATEPLTFLKVTVDGSGQEHQEKKANPLVSKVLAAQPPVRALLAELGQTPASRARVRIPGASKDDVDPSTDFSEWLRPRGRR